MTLRRRSTVLMPVVPVVETLDLEQLPVGVLSRLRVHMVSNAMGDPIRLPVMVARGENPGPVVGITAAVHGNELNGLPIIHQLFRAIDPQQLAGTLVAVPVVNIPGFLANQREFSDGVDLNRAMPGDEHGTCSAVFAQRLLTRIVSKFEYLIDLHTASFGRLNTFYVRADLSKPVPAQLARLQQPQIILHNAGGDSTLRGAASALGIQAITVEVGDPQRFQRDLIAHTLAGLRNVIGHLKMMPWEIQRADHEPLICTSSYWMYTDSGGLLEVFPDLGERLRKGQIVARVSNAFGDIGVEYVAPEDGVVIGKSANPVNQTGSRILHLGRVGELT